MGIVLSEEPLIRFLAMMVAARIAPAIEEIAPHAALAPLVATRLFLGGAVIDDPQLAENERKLPVSLQTTFWVADFGEFESLSSLGVNYVAVSERAYGRFFDPDVHAAPDDWHYSARRRFYEKLFAEGELVWSSNPDPPTYSFVNPALRLYRISEHR